MKRRGWKENRERVKKGQRLSKIGRIFAEGTLVDRALQAAALDALRLHKQAGVPVVVYRDGKVLTVPAGPLLRARMAAQRRSRVTKRAAKKGRA